MNVRFMATKTGRVHVVTTPGADKKSSKCTVVKKGHDDGAWGRKKGLSPDAAMELDDCARCGSHAVAAEAIEASKTPAQKRAEAKQRRDETMAKASNSKPKKQPKAKQDGEPKRRGPKGGDVEARMKANVEEHASYAEQHGWEAKGWESGTHEWTCEATRDGETLKIIWRDGRTVWSRVTLRNGVEVRLRNSSNWRKHARGESKINPDYKPRERGGKKAMKAQVIDDSAPRSLPFNLEDDDDETIAESLLGREITWRMSMTRQLESAAIPTRARNVRITAHPKSDRRMISFFERQGANEDGDLLGMERTVYLDKILKVR